MLNSWVVYIIIGFHSFLWLGVVVGCQVDGVVYFLWRSIVFGMILWIGFVDLPIRWFFSWSLVFFGAWLVAVRLEVPSRA